jgi:DNA-binding response OmpR family regulator
MDERRVAIVVEDDEDIRVLLAAILAQSGFEVHVAETGWEGIGLVQAHAPDLVTLDVGLPDIDGFEVVRRVRLRNADVHIVIVTARTDEIDAIQGLEIGADMYITKPFRPRELRAHVEAMMRRRRKRGSPAPRAVSLTAAKPVERNEMLELNGLVLDPSEHSVSVDGAAVPLTPSEFLLLHVLLSGGRLVRSKAELVRFLRGDGFDSGTLVVPADERAVEVHVGNLRRKLGDRTGEPRWIETVRGIGYRAAPPR